ELLSHLSVLKDSELLYERGIFPQSTFVFKHALTREVVYDSILAKRRKLLHDKIGRVIEELYADNISDHYGVLAEHFLVSDVHDKAAKYARLASKKAEKATSLNDAILYAEKGIACLERLPTGAEVLKKIIDARTILALYLTQMNYFGKAKEIVDPIKEAAAQGSYGRRLSQICAVTGMFECWVQEDVSRALEQLTLALRLAEKVGETVSLFFAHFWLGCALCFDCRFEEAFAHIREALKINIAVNNLWGVSVMKSNQSLFQFFHGKIDLSFRTGTEAVRLAEQSGDILSSTWAHTLHGVALYGRGALEESIENLSRGVDLAARINQLFLGAVARSILAETHLEIEGHELAKICCREAIELIERMRWLPSFANLTRMILIKGQTLSGERTTELAQLHSYVRLNRLKIYEGWTRRYLGEILLILGKQHLPEAQPWIEQAIEADERNGMRWHLARDIAVYSELFKRKGDREKAREQLGIAIDIYKECGADGWVTRAEEEMAKLS
ncbi:MAG TPA: hypothetical protein VLS45_05645, partial [Methylomicrobium sp.]|nr:hypothetical protein [Methylomicrobium sp.]